MWMYCIKTAYIDLCKNCLRQWKLKTGFKNDIKFHVIKRHHKEPVVLVHVSFLFRNKKTITNIMLYVLYVLYYVLLLLLFIIIIIPVIFDVTKPVFHKIWIVYIITHYMCTCIRSRHAALSNRGFESLPTWRGWRPVARRGAPSSLPPRSCAPSSRSPCRTPCHHWNRDTQEIQDRWHMNYAPQFQESIQNNMQ